MSFMQPALNFSLQLYTRFTDCDQAGSFKLPLCSLQLYLASDADKTAEEIAVRVELFGWLVGLP